MGYPYGGTARSSQVFMWGLVYPFIVLSNAWLFILILGIPYWICFGIKYLIIGIKRLKTRAHNNNLMVKE